MAYVLHKTELLKDQGLSLFIFISPRLTTVPGTVQAMYRARSMKEGAKVPIWQLKDE